MVNVATGDDEALTTPGWTKRHEAHDLVVPEDDAGRGAPLDDLAEDALHVESRLLGWLGQDASGAS